MQPQSVISLLAQCNNTSTEASRRTGLDITVHQATAVQVRERRGDCRCRYERVDGVAAARQRVGQQLHDEAHAPLRVHEPAVQLNQVGVAAAAGAQKRQAAAGMTQAFSNNCTRQVVKMDSSRSSASLCASGGVRPSGGSGASARFAGSVVKRDEKMAMLGQRAFEVLQHFADVAAAFAAQHVARECLGQHLDCYGAVAPPRRLKHLALAARAQHPAQAHILLGQHAALQRQRRRIGSALRSCCRVRVMRHLVSAAPQSQGAVGRDAPPRRHGRRAARAGSGGASELPGE